ncbi:MAG: TonB-dependent receptor plug domain-containing protein [Bacteroidales bacterium]|nr:TonB-dependent receptor plug domain-containing protein [Bacteroidales bacterium]
MKFTFVFLFVLVNGCLLFGQSTFTGSVIDVSTGLSVPDVEIIAFPNHLITNTDAKGNFTFQRISFPFTIQVRHIGYKEELKTIQREDIQPYIITLTPVSIPLSEINILEDLAQERKNPVSFSSISAVTISTDLGDRPLPEILENTAGLYASRDGGGSGDASVMIRGFGQENIAVLLNGVPINGAENGLVYWNNWIGLTEAAGSIQIQKGIGASKVAMNSVGGTINIVTKKQSMHKSALFSYNLTDYGNQKATFIYNSGQLKNGSSVSLLVSRTTGQGYIDATYVNGWAYYLNINKQLTKKQYLSFTMLGGPEKHGQRNLKLSKEEIDHFGYKYNKDWGSLNGELKNTSENFYHKPFISLNHFYTPDINTTIANSVYFSPGWGGGKWSDSFIYGPGIFDFRNASGQLDWDSIYQYNRANQSTFVLDNGDTVSGFSKLVQTDFLANHLWAGWVTNIEKEFNPDTKLITGLHYRYFSSTLTEKVSDLLGGQFYIDDYSWSLAGVAGRNQIKKPGDIIRMQNGALLHQINVFVQLEKKTEKANLFLAGTISNSTQSRHDVYNYPDDKWSAKVNKSGFDLKGGINYNFSATQNLYVNGGYFSKVPYFKFIFGNFTNVPVQNIQNEKVTTFETGYGFKNEKVNIIANAYYTLWQDVSFLSNEYIQLENNQMTRAMVNGLDATHIGIEFQANYKFNDKINTGAFLSLGNWKWSNDVEARLFDDNDQLVDTVQVYAKGLYVGGQPQFQSGIFLNTIVLDFFHIKYDIRYNTRNYAMFDPTQRTTKDDNTQSLLLPSWFVSNIRLQIPLNLFQNEMLIYANCNNLFNTHYILKGEDGSTHDMDTFRGFWSFGRTIDVGFKLNF